MSKELIVEHIKSMLLRFDEAPLRAVYMVVRQLDELITTTKKE